MSSVSVQNAHFNVDFNPNEMLFVIYKLQIKEGISK